MQHKKRRVLDSNVLVPALMETRWMDGNEGQSIGTIIVNRKKEAFRHATTQRLVRKVKVTQHATKK